MFHSLVIIHETVTSLKTRSVTSTETLCKLFLCEVLKGNTKLEQNFKVEITSDGKKNIAFTCTDFFFWSLAQFRSERV